MSLKVHPAVNCCMVTDDRRKLTDLELKQARPYAYLDLHRWYDPMHTIIEWGAVNQVYYQLMIVD